MSKADIAFLENKLKELPQELTKLKRKKKTDEVRKKINSTIDRIQRLKRWIKELEENL